MLLSGSVRSCSLAITNAQAMGYTFAYLHDVNSGQQVHTRMDVAISGHLPTTNLR